MIRRLVLMLSIVALAGGMVACGKKGAPERPEGDPDYPRNYPTS